MNSNARRLGAALVVGAVLGAGAVGVATAAISTATFCANVTPGSSGFNDIGDVSASLRADIECLASSRITSGTAPATYSPTGDVFRDSMATFVAKLVDTANNLETETLASLPADPPDAFGDDEASTHEANINRLAAAGIVSGKTATTYGPNGDGNEVTRGQMATFLVSAIDYLRADDLPDAPDAFADDAGNAHEDNIDKLAAIDVVDGVGGTSYDPNGNVSRAQMAAFLIRTLAYLHAEGDIAALPPSLQSIAVTPVGPVTNATDAVAGDEMPVVASNIEVGDVDVLLLPCENVSVDDGISSFADNDDDGGADRGADQVDADIVSVNGTAQAADTEFVSGVAVTNGTISFNVDSPTPDCVVALVWDDADDDDALDLDDLDQPSEHFGRSGPITFVPPAATAGAMDENVESKGTGTFVGCEISVPLPVEQVDRTDCATFAFDSTDTYTIDGEASNLAAFTAALSPGDDVSGTYDPDPADQSTFALVDEAPVPPGTVQAQAVDGDTVNVVFSEVPGADSYRVYRHEDANVLTCDAFTTTGDGAYVLAGSVGGGAADNDAGTTNNFAVSGLTPSTDYCFAVTTVDAGDEGPPSMPVEATTTAVVDQAAPEARDTELFHDTSDAADLIRIDGGDTIRICFSEDIADPQTDPGMLPLQSDTESITMEDGDGTVARLTQGENAEFDRMTAAEPRVAAAGASCAANRTLRIIITGPLDRTSEGSTPGLAVGADITVAAEIQDLSDNDFAPAGDNDVEVDVEPGPEPD